jgi:tetratricopeptide (TPR) repeat protein
MNEISVHRSGQRIVLALMACGLIAMFTFAVHFRVQNPSLTQRRVQHGQQTDRAQVMAMIGQLMEKLQDNPNDTTTLENLGMIFSSMQEWKRASHFWQRLLEIDSRNLEAHQQLALCLFRTKDHDQAVDHLKTVLELDPNNAYALYNLAMIHTYYLDDPEKGRLYFQELLRQNNVDEQLQDKARQELQVLEQ